MMSPRIFGRTALAVALCSLLVPAPAEPQDVYGPDDEGWRPGLDTLVVYVPANAEWRNFLVGDLAGVVFADLILAGAPASATSGLGLTGQVTGLWVFGERADAVATGGGSVGLTAGWWFPGPAAPMIGLTAEAYTFPRGERDTDGVEVGVRVAGIDVPWGLEEKNPTLSIGAYRDFGSLDAARIDLVADIGLWIQNAAILGGRETGAHIEGKVGWAEQPGDGNATEVDPWSWRAGLRLGVDWGVHTVLLRVGATEPRNASVKLFAELALRIWPDAPPL